MIKDLWAVLQNKLFLAFVISMTMCYSGLFIIGYHHPSTFWQWVLCSSWAVFCGFIGTAIAEKIGKELYHDEN